MKPLLKIAQLVQLLSEIEYSMRITYTEEEMRCECKKTGFVKIITYNMLETKGVNAIAEEFLKEYKEYK